ncbi:hypothetical protein QK911_04500 [Lactococcus lactis]
MKLSEIEVVSPEDFVVFEDEMPYSYVIDRGCKENAIEVEDFPKLYTAEQMQEYAKECVREAIILNSGGVVSDDMIKRAIDSVFKEDTKND